MKARPITIVQQDEGYLVTVGCQTVVRERASQLIAELAMYLDNPAAFEKRYMAAHPEVRQDQYDPGPSTTLHGVDIGGGCGAAPSNNPNTAYAGESVRGGAYAGIPRDLVR